MSRVIDNIEDIASIDSKVAKVTSTDNAIARYDGTSGAIQNSSVVIDDSGSVGIGTSSPTMAKVQVSGTTYIPTSDSLSQVHTMLLQDIANKPSLSLFANSANSIIYATSAEQYRSSLIHRYNADGGSDCFKVEQLRPSSGDTLERMRITSSGNLLVGTTTDNGVDKLQVNGSISASNKLVYQSRIIGTFTGGEWYDTGVTTDTLGYNILDTFAITVYEDSYETGNSNWSMLYKFIVGSAITVSNNSNTFDIPTLSAVGNAKWGGSVSLRWQLVYGHSPAKIQFKVTHTSTFDNSYGKYLEIFVTKLI